MGHVSASVEAEVQNVEPNHDNTFKFSTQTQLKQILPSFHWKRKFYMGTNVRDWGGDEPTTSQVRGTTGSPDKAHGWRTL